MANLPVSLPLMIACGVALTGCGAGGGNTSATIPAPATTAAEDVTYQINSAHTGAITFSRDPIFPSAPTWSRTFPGAVSYPIIAGGMVYVTVADSASIAGSSLYALSEATGSTVWGPIELGGDYHWSALAYDAGRVFAVNENAVAQSFNAATGIPESSASMPGGGFTEAPPVAVNGTLYLEGGVSNSLAAFSETNMALQWAPQLYGGFGSTPTVALSGDGTTDAIFVAAPFSAYELTPSSGSIVWRYYLPVGSGTGVDATVYYAGSLYARDITDANFKVNEPNGTIFNAATGAITGTFNSVATPAFAGSLGYYLVGTTLTATNIATSKAAWAFTGDGQLTTAPIVINQDVIIGSSTGNVYALNAATGALLWTGKAPAAFGADEVLLGNPSPGLGAGEGYLVCPAGATLTTWRVTPQ